VLLADSIVAVAGAVGTPVLTGLEIPLSLSKDFVADIYTNTGIIICLAGLVVLLFMIKLYIRQEGKIKYMKYIFLMYVFFIVPFIIFTFFASEFSVILAALCMLVISATVFKKGEQKIVFKPWLPYLALIVLLLLPKVLPPLRSMINWDIQFNNLWSSGIDASFKPLVVPLIPFVVVGIGVMWVKKSRKFYLADILQKVMAVFIILFPAIAISQLMVNSDTSQPSMVAHIATMLQQTGSLYPLSAPLLGITGAFITGSTTVSNLIFGAAQLKTSQLLSLNESLVLSLQNCGASLGNSICLFNIIAAATVANIGDYKQILKNNLTPAIVAGLTAGISGMILLYIVR
jgi:lactate permease